MQGPLRMLAATLLCAVVLPAGSAFAQADSNRTTFLLSRAYDGGLPNGVSRNAAVSHDQRIARHIAFESDATNIVPGDTNGLTDVFVVHRAGPWGHNGTPWQIGSTDLVSRGLGVRRHQPGADEDEDAGLADRTHQPPAGGHQAGVREDPQGRGLRPRLPRAHLPCLGQLEGPRRQWQLLACGVRPRGQGARV